MGPVGGVCIEWRPSEWGRLVGEGSCGRGLRRTRLALGGAQWAGLMLREASCGRGLRRTRFALGGARRAGFTLRGASSRRVRLWAGPAASGARWAGFTLSGRSVGVSCGGCVLWWAGPHKAAPPGFAPTSAEHGPGSAGRRRTPAAAAAPAAAAGGAGLRGRQLRPLGPVPAPGPLEQPVARGVSGGRGGAVRPTVLGRGSPGPGPPGPYLTRPPPLSSSPGRWRELTSSKQDLPSHLSRLASAGVPYDPAQQWGSR
ncbi:transmembrane protein 52 isoform X2 [Pan paniscus]|uniref:transmembrane protein 52 isoform X2 n=1 Tax=Pan paniscus TaxID=9597 RepID=UPI00156131E7|nr:transmembrane protein 52 isoform X2 [Pan paniscus]